VFSFHQSRGPVEVAFTDRQPGDGFGRDGSLDLAEPKPDASDRESDVAVLEENLDIAAYAMARGGKVEGGSPFDLPAGVAVPVLVRMHQVHGADVHTVDKAWLASGSQPAVADGLVTNVPGVILVVRAADCVPVVLADTEHRVVGVAHAGRQGLVAGIVPNTVARMRELGAQEITAWVGPSICGRCYEVPAAMREAVAAAVPEAYAETSWGTPAVDVAAGVRAQLRTAGVEVVDASRCTFEHDDLFSYRRQGAASGRLGGLVWVRP
jgi:YfiH family protein